VDEDMELTLSELTLFDYVLADKVVGQNGVWRVLQGE